MCASRQLPHSSLFVRVCGVSSFKVALIQSSLASCSLCLRRFANTNTKMIASRIPASNVFDMASSSTLSRHSFILAVLSVAVNAVAAYDPRYAFFRPGAHSDSQSLSIFDRPTRSRNAPPSLLASAPEFPEFAPHVEEQPFDVPSYFMAMSRSKKDKPIRRCGLRLIKHVQVSNLKTSTYCYPLQPNPTATVVIIT